MINFITDIARFTSDTTMGVYYLSTEEGQRRIDTYCENIVIFGKAFDQYCDSLTAKDIAKATGHILGDVVFLNGASAVGTFLKEIDALGKISNEAKVIAQGLKSAIEEHPAFETAEGIVLKMSQEVKDVGCTIKTAYNSIIDTKIFSNLRSIGENIWQSHAGIIYGNDKKFGNTFNHMLTHMTPNLTKKVHTVFSVPQNKIVELIDEAWMLKGNPLLSDPRAYLVDMKRIIGTQGETAIRIVVKKSGTCELLTAYPATL